MIIRISNDYSNWDEVYDKVRSSPAEKEYKIVVPLSGDESRDSADVLELCYIFPLADYILQHDQCLVVDIRIALDTGGGSRRRELAVESRVQALLQAQACRFQRNDHIRFLINGRMFFDRFGQFVGESLEEQTVYGELSSETQTSLRGALLLSRRKTEDGSEERRILPSRRLKDPESIINEIKNKAEERYGKKFDVILEKRADISRIAPIISIGLERDDSSVFLEDLINRNDSVEPRDNLQLRYLYNACYRLERYLEDADNYIGYQSSHFNRATKEGLARQISLFLKKKLPSMNLLSKCIWLYTLRDFLESKELFGLAWDEDGNEEYFPDLELLEKSHLNAVSYAEGLYQLIENACQYSNGKRAYWGMRIYRSGLGGGISESLKRAATNKALSEKYRLCASADATPNEGVAEKKLSSRSIFTKNYSRLLEFYVIDEAMRGNGLLMTPSKDKHFDTIEALIEDSPQVSNDNWDAFSDDISNHYGLRIFSRIVDLNDGYMIVRSPHGMKKTDTLFRRFQSNFHHKNIESMLSRTTSFRFIVPLIPEWESAKETKSEHSGLLFVEDSLSPVQTSCVKMEAASSTTVNGIHSKVNEVNMLVKKMSAALEQTGENAILTVDLRGGGAYDAELLAKALFKLSIQRCKGNSTMYAAVLFSEDTDEPQEFVRIFASFYDKMSERKNEGANREDLVEILRKLQVAICTEKSDMGTQGSALTVDFILSGESPALAFQSAKNYLYMNFSSSFRFIPVLRYLAYVKNASKSGREETRWFPFGLYLNSHSFDSGKKLGCDPWLSSVFLDRIEKVLNTELQEHEDGCRIANIHVRLGSKIHLDSFYEAELLFRSIGNVQGFAYLIANDLIRTRAQGLLSNDPSRVILVGYEKYSAELVSQVFNWLKLAGWPSTACVIPTEGVKQNQCVQLAAWGEERFGEHETLPRALLVTIIPVGSTMSTVYKVRNLAGDYFQKRYAIDVLDENSSAILDYCIVAVSSRLENNLRSEGGQAILDSLTRQFWESADTRRKIICVKPDRKNGRELRVKYLLSAEANWSEPIGTGEDGSVCEECEKLIILNADKPGERVPLLQVDKSSMIPDTIFKLKDSRLRLLQPKSKKENTDRINRLKGLIRYGHICENDNHYQFYFDLATLFQRNREDIEKWLESVEIDASAYNIIIAPNDIDCAPFLCTVMEKVFRNSLRFLHLNINKAYREDVRLKFSHMADEYRRLRREMPNVPLRIYYMTDTVSSTKTISRAQLLVEMLLSESGLRGTSGKFAKVIMLLCRSSYDTMKQFVSNPKEDVVAWLTLNIPPYNTLADRCPACELLGKYALLRKRSATETIGAMFERLEEKHARRSVAEYDQWLIDAILHDHSYYAGFKQFFYFHYKNGKGLNVLHMTVAQAHLMESALKKEFETVCLSLMSSEDSPEANLDKFLICLRTLNTESSNLLRDTFRDRISERTLEDLLTLYNEIADAEDRLDISDLINIVRDTVVATRNFRRLVCLQEAYEELTTLQSGADSIETMNQELDVMTRATILALISAHLSPDPKSKEAYAENAEWLISFIKVLSRELLVKYYHVHRAIVNIMYDMLNYINYGDSSDELASKLGKEDSNWRPILRTLRFSVNEKKRTEDTVLCASLQYEIFMTLVHRLSVLQCSLVYEKNSIDSAIEGLTRMVKKYFGMEDYSLSRKDLINVLTYTELPPTKMIRNRYIKSVKTATMLTSNDDPCYRMARELRGEKR